MVKKDFRGKNNFPWKQRQDIAVLIFSTSLFQIPLFFNVSGPRAYNINQPYLLLWQADK